MPANSIVRVHVIENNGTGARNSIQKYLEVMERSHCTHTAVLLESQNVSSNVK